MTAKEPTFRQFEVPDLPSDAVAMNIIIQVVEELPEEDRARVFKASAIMLGFDR